jgi:hypothetical protein
MARNSVTVQGVGINTRKTSMENKLFIHPSVIPEVRNWVIDNSPVNTLLDNPKFQFMNRQQQLEMLADYRKKQAKACSKLYGPAHPQSYESLYPTEALFEELDAMLGARK